MRLRDVEVWADAFPSSAFYGRALEMKGEAAVVPEWLDLSGLPAAIASIGRHHPLVVLHREEEAPGEVAIGRVREVLDDGIRLRWITPDARWEDDDTRYAYDAITRVEFDGEYERTLALVAGPPPGV